MISSLIVYGLLVLCILSWIQPRQRLKNENISEPNGRDPYQSRSCGVKTRTGKRMHVIPGRRHPPAYPVFQQKHFPADLIIQRVNSIWHSRRQRPCQNKKRRRKKTRKV
jgi:hypothetical protein